MRYLSTLLLTTTVLTTTYIHGADQLHEPTASAPTMTASAPVIAETQAKIDGFRDLVTKNADFNVSDAGALLFSPELHPYISWRSAERNEAVVDSVRKAMVDGIKTSLEPQHQAYWTRAKSNYIL